MGVETDPYRSVTSPAHANYTNKAPKIGTFGLLVSPMRLYRPGTRPAHENYTNKAPKIGTFGLFGVTNETL